METHEFELDRVDVRRAAAGDTVAFERLYRRYVARIHSLARRLLGVSRADDATQEVFLRAWRKLPSYRGEGAFGAWLHSLARNWILSEVRRSRRDKAELGLDEAAKNLSAPATQPEHAVDLDSAIRQLPSGARRVLVLRHFAGCSHLEIAELLGVSVGTSKSQLHRARTLLRAGLEGPVGGSEGTS